MISQSNNRRSWLVIGLAAIVLVAAGIWQQREIISLRKERESLLAQARDRGIETLPSTPMPRRVVTKRGDPLEEARALADELIHRASSGDSYRSDWSEQAILLERLQSMSPEQLRELIRLFRESEIMPSELRFGVIFDCISRLGDDFPREALDLAADLAVIYPGLLTGYQFWDHVGSIAGRYAERDPEACWAWFLEVRDGWPETRKIGAVYSMFEGMSRSDPAAALRRAAESGVEGISFLSRGTQTIDQKIAVLSAVRAWSEEDPSRQNLLKEHIQAATLKSTYQQPNRFDEVTSWIKEARLPLDEIAFLADASSLDLCYYIDPQDTGKWITWLCETFPADQVNRRVSIMFTDHRTKTAA